MIGRECVLLLYGGDKRKQSSDIVRALEYLKDYKDKDRNRMKRKASISHDEAIIRRLRKDPDFAAEYLKAALEVTYKSRHYRSELQPFQIPFTSDISLTTVHIRTASAGASG